MIILIICTIIIFIYAIFIISEVDSNNKNYIKSIVQKMLDDDKERYINEGKEQIEWAIEEYYKLTGERKENPYKRLYPDV